MTKTIIKSEMERKIFPQQRGLDALTGVVDTHKNK